MDDSLREKLRGLIQTHGTNLTQDVPKWKQLVEDVCQGSKREKNVLIAALEEEVPTRLQEAPGGAADEALRTRLSQALQDNQGISEPLARWAVDSWAAALGLMDGAPAPAAVPATVPVAEAAAVAAPVAEAAFDIDPPACFYLGREYDLDRQQVIPDKFVMYDARDLTTHGVIVGMTGSGKTGLAITILEEAAIDGYPCVIIDPKGDLTNLLLQFPDLNPEEIARWVDFEDARAFVERREHSEKTQGQSVAPREYDEPAKKELKREYAKHLADRWLRGLTETHQAKERIKTLQRCDWRVYTPGSDAGWPISVLSNFKAPKKDDLPHELLLHKVEATTSALLGLTDVSIDLLQSREHILVAKLLQRAWEAKRDLDLQNLILQIQSPPFQTVGAYSLETFFPAKDRIKFAAALNNVLASPSFSVWRQGDPLDLDTMLEKKNRPQQLIFHIAHLDTQQRMFFVTLLLEEMLNWTRRQKGSSNLRALLYFDEVAGYLPPHPANPPSKGPLLTLFKQARAFGVGVLLATQNPVDLDYKSLSNAGTWFIGKLQTERDKSRLLKGMETVAAEGGGLTDRKYLEKVIPALGNRVFFMHDLHRDKPVLFQSRFTLTLLRGPMTRDEISELKKEILKRGAPMATPVPSPASGGKGESPFAPRVSGPMAIPLCPHCQAELGLGGPDRCPACGKRPWATTEGSHAEQEPPETDRQASVGSPQIPASAVPTAPPVLPADVTQFYLSRQGQRPSESQFEAKLLAVAEVTFVVEKRRGLEHVQPIRLLAMPPEPGSPADWHHAEPLVGDVGTTAPSIACWDDVPSALDTGRKLKSLAKAFADYLYSTQKLSLFENRHLGFVSAPGESLELFRDRCRQAAVGEMEKALQMEKVKFGPKFEALGTKLPEEQPPKKVVGFWGRMVASVTPISRPANSGPPATPLEAKQRKLAGEYQAKKNEICEKWKRIGEEAMPVEVKPRKTDVRITHFGIAWAPK
jgi:hypothetical protein